MKEYLLIILAVLSLSLSSCLFPGGGKSKSALPDDGQLHGVAPIAKQSMNRPINK